MLESDPEFGAWRKKLILNTTPSSMPYRQSGIRWKGEKNSKCGVLFFFLERATLGPGEVPQGDVAGAGAERDKRCPSKTQQQRPRHPSAAQTLSPTRLRAG